MKVRALPSEFRKAENLVYISLVALWLGTRPLRARTGSVFRRCGGLSPEAPSVVAVEQL